MATTEKNCWMRCCNKNIGVSAGAKVVGLDQRAVTNFEKVTVVHGNCADER